MNWFRVRLGLAIAAASGLFAFCGIAWWVGSALVAPARHPVGDPPKNLPVAFTTIPNNSGNPLAAWYIPVENSPATLILLHPLRGDRRSMLGRAKLFLEAGYSVLLVDLQAHGESEGDRITFGYRESKDVRAIVRFVRKTHPNRKIGIVGWSLGGASAVLASPLNIDALVLESVYPSIAQAVRNRIAIRLGPLSNLVSPALLVQLKPRLGIAPSDLRPIDRIGQVGCPILIASGDRDRHTTLTETQQLFEAAREPKQLVAFEGSAHEDLLAKNPQQYRAQVLSFLDARLQAPVDRASNSLPPRGLH